MSESKSRTEPLGKSLMVSDSYRIMQRRNRESAVLSYVMVRKTQFSNFASTRMVVRSSEGPAAHITIVSSVLFHVW